MVSEDKWYNYIALLFLNYCQFSYIMSLTDNGIREKKHSDVKKDTYESQNFSFRWVKPTLILIKLILTLNIIEFIDEKLFNFIQT